MKRFSYFFPIVPAVNAVLIAKHGLQYAFAEGPLGSAGVMRGPEGHNGAIGVCGDAVGYHPDRQTWIAAPRGDEELPPYWIGWETDQNPTPEDLSRKDAPGGKAFTLENGSVWRVPRIMTWHESSDQPAVWSSPLPRMLDLDRYGEMIDGPIVPKYRDLFDAGMQILVRLVGKSSDPIPPQSFYRFACDCLGVNYAVSELELSASVLDCLSTRDATAIVHHAIDLEGFIDAANGGLAAFSSPSRFTQSLISHGN